MIEIVAAVSVLLAYVFAWSLPVTFFRRDGRLNLMWALTALPFAAGPTLMCLGLFDVIPVFPLPHGMAMALQLLGIGLALLSIALIRWTVKTHRVPLSLWHQENDSPVGIVTSGPYAMVRHPFYVAFILATLAALATAPQIGLVACFAYAFVILNHTAAREERKLLDSEFGDEYRAYVERSGRFWPSGR